MQGDKLVETVVEAAARAPTVTGSTGLQQGTDTTAVSVPTGEINRGTLLPHPVVDAVYAAADARSVAQMGVRVIPAILDQQNRDVQRTNKLLDAERAEVKALRQELADERVKSARLEEQLRTKTEVRVLRDLGLIVGPVVIAVGADLVRGTPPAIAVGSLLIAAGMAITVAAWFSNRQRD